MVEQSEYKKAGRYVTLGTVRHHTPITIVGWTTLRERKHSTNNWSLRRARTVRNYLVSKGVTAGRISIEGRGVDTQAASNDEARRAEIAGVIYLSAKSLPAEVKQETKVVTPVVVEKETEPVREEQEIKEEIQQVEQQVTPVQQEVKSEPEQTHQPMQTDELVSVSQTSSRYVAVKTNLTAWAGTIMNLAADVQVSEHFSVELPVLWCPWARQQ